MAELQLTDGAYRISSADKDLLQKPVKAHLKEHGNLKNFPEIYIDDELQVVRNQKHWETRKLGFGSKEKDTARKKRRVTRTTPQRDELLDWALKNNYTEADVDKYLDTTGKEFKQFDKDVKAVSKESVSRGGPKLEAGHEIGVAFNVRGQSKDLYPPTTTRNLFVEPFEANRGKGSGGSNKSISLKATTGRVPKNIIEDFVMYKNPDLFPEFHKEFSTDEQAQIRKLRPYARSTTADDLQTEIYNERDRKAYLPRFKDAELTAPNAKSLFRKIVRVGQGSNNLAINFGSDLVGTIMDGAAFVADPSLENGIDLALSGGQVVANLAALGLAALPVPGARPGAYMIMRLADVAAKGSKKARQASNALASAERLWNMQREGIGMALDQRFPKKTKQGAIENFLTEKDGVLVNKNYTPGKDPAFDAALKAAQTETAGGPKVGTTGLGNRISVKNLTKPTKVKF